MRINRYTLSNTPFQMRIAVLSDIHDRLFPAEALLGPQNVDLILIPGDVTKFHLCEEAWLLEQNELTEKDGIPKCRVTRNDCRLSENARIILKRLAQIAPSYMCPGNHEWAWNRYDRKIVEDAGVTLLENEFVRIRPELVLCGWRSVTGTNRFAFSTDCISAFCSQKGYKILLMHEPQLYPAYIAETNIDLTVSGHAHGGQWRFFGQGIFAPGQGFFPKYTRGFYDRNRMLVSAGMTNTTRVPRIFNPCEIVILELKN